MMTWKLVLIALFVALVAYGVVYFWGGKTISSRPIDEE
jgi:hypothetical protein